MQRSVFGRRWLVRQRSLASASRPASTSAQNAQLNSLIAYGERVLRTPEPLEKVALTFECKARWDAGELPVWHGDSWTSDPPVQPARSAKPPLLMPKQMPAMKDLDTTIPISILHALAHIELGAIDNYWDTLVRFDPKLHALPREFYHDFLIVASDEARHFKMVDDRLREIGSYYGELPATLALLEHASNTASDLAARIAVIPLVQEARGLDSGDRLVHKLQSMGDKPSAEIVAQIVFEERSHVSYGIKWFRHLCDHHAEIDDPIAYFHKLVYQFFPDGLPGPFDVQARIAANMEEEWYQPLESKGRASSATAAKASEPSAPSTAARAAYQSQRKVILAGLVWPERTSSAAGVRSADLVEILQSHGFHVTCVSPSRLNAHTEALRDQHNVHCVQADANSDVFQQVLQNTAPEMVLFDRFIAEEMYGWQAKKYAPKALRVLDLQDVHFIRKAREFLVKKRHMPFEQTLDMSQLDVDPVEKQVVRELASIHRSDLTLFVSDVEQDVLTERFQVPEHALHRCDFFYPSTDAAHWPAFESRKDIAFIGSFKHAPNVDAIEWLKQTIWPEFRKQQDQTSGAEMHIYGSYGDAVKYIKMDDPATGFRMKGFAPNVHETLQQYRLTVAPLRFGAGIKGKIADSWYVGTPCVSTSIGAEGMLHPDDGSSSWGGQIVDSSEAIAKAMHELYTQPTEWSQAQATGVEICDARYSREKNASALIQRLEQAQKLKDKQHQAGGENWIGRILWSEKYRATEYLSRFIRAKNGLPAP